MRSLPKRFTVVCLFLSFVGSFAQAYLTVEEALLLQHQIKDIHGVESSDSASVVFGGSSAFTRSYIRYDKTTSKCLMRTIKNIGGESDIETEVSDFHCAHLKNPLGFFEGRSFQPKELELKRAPPFRSATLFVQRRTTGERICAVTWGVSGSIRSASVVYSVNPEHCKQ